jgi:hypothetical protein
MRSFFDGSQRKVGLLTLVAALATSALWFRAHLVHDILFCPSLFQTQIVWSADDSIVFVRSKEEIWVSTLSLQTWRPVRTNPWYRPWERPGIGWHFDHAGFRIGIDATLEFFETRVQFFVVPYWFFVLLLTTIAGLLLLRSNRKSDDPIVLGTSAAQSPLR